jgi:hypothetical protein
MKKRLSMSGNVLLLWQIREEHGLDLTDDYGNYFGLKPELTVSSILLCQRAVAIAIDELRS